MQGPKPRNRRSSDRRAELRQRQAFISFLSRKFPVSVHVDTTR